jgi:predicted Rdx family selenoprotein
LAASLNKRFDEKAEIKAGNTGQFDVVVDGQVIFSKAKAGRFPVEGEVEDLFAALKPDTKAADAELPKDRGSGGRAGMLRRMSDKFRN